MALDTSPISIASEDMERTLTVEEKKKVDEIMDRRSYLANVCRLSFLHAADARRRYDYEWMVRDLFRRGFMYSRYQPTTQTVILASRQSARIPINIVMAQMRAIVNQITSFRPKWETMPKNTTEESRVQARYTGKLLDYYFDHLNLKKKIKETVIQGLMYSVGGPWQVVYDEEKKEVNIWLLDPFDFYFDPLAESLEEAEFMIKAVRRPLGEVKYNPNYDELARKEIHGGESKLAVSEYKQFMLQALKYVTQFNQQESPALILYEGYFRVRDKETGKAHLRKVIWTEQNATPLLYEDLETNEYDFAIYQADLNPKEILGESWFKHVMPVNRVINALESSVYDYNYRIAKGRIVVDRDSGVRSISNVHGEIISKNRGAEVRALDMPSLPVATGAQIERMNRYLEDIGAVHDASLGRTPPGVKSGIGLAELKQSDSTGQNDFVDNLEDFLTLVGSKILKKIADNYDKVKVIKDLGYREEEGKYFAVVGKNYKKKDTSLAGHKGQVKIGPDWLDLAIVGEDNNVRVTIGSWLGYTKEMMQEKTLKLLQLGAIDQATFLRLWEFGDVNQIVEQSRREQLFKSRLNAKQGEVPTVDPYVENDMMVLEGKPVMPQPTDDHLIHIAIHQDALGRGNDDLVEKHIAAHQIYAGQEQPMEQVSSPDQGMGMGQMQESMPSQDMMRNQQIQGQQPNQGITQPTGFTGVGSIVGNA